MIIIFFINPTDEYEISIPTDILQLIKCNISKPLSEILNLSFSTSIYPDKNC